MNRGVGVGVGGVAGFTTRDRDTGGVDARLRGSCYPYFFSLAQLFVVTLFSQISEIKKKANPGQAQKVLYGRVLTPLWEFCDICMLCV